MRVGVDARALLAGRGVSRVTRGMLAALAEGFAADEWLAFVPGRAPVAPVHPRVRLVRHRLGGRALFGAAAVARRPTLAALVGGADVVWLPAPAPVAPGARYVLTVHDRSWERRPHDFSAYQRAWHALARPRRLARGAAGVTADSRAVAAELLTAWGVRATVVSPGVVALPARPRAGRYLLYVGAREPRKGLDVLTAAHTRARAQGLDAELVLVGDGVRPVGDAELAALYAGALAVVAPSYLEGFGLPPLEAAAHGTPAVVSDLPCFAETLGDAVLRVAPGDVDGLAAALVRIAGDDELRARLGAAARERAAAYTWKGAAARLHALLSEAAS